MSGTIAWETTSTTTLSWRSIIGSALRKDQDYRQAGGEDDRRLTQRVVAPIVGQHRGHDVRGLRIMDRPRDVVRRDIDAGRRARVQALGEARLGVDHQGHEHEQDGHGQPLQSSDLRFIPVSAAMKSVPVTAEPSEASVKETSMAPISARRSARVKL